MAQNVSTRRFYIDIDHSDDHTVIRRVPVHQASWVATEPTTPAPVSPATHSHLDHVRATPHRLGDVFRSVRKRRHHS